MDGLAQALAYGATVPVTLSSLSALSSAELALAALRPDLPPLIRQRAYHAFEARRAAYHATPDTHEADTLLDIPLDIPIPSTLSSLSPAQLLLLQFHPSADPSLLPPAHHLLLSLLASMRKGRELHVLRMCVRWEGGERREEGWVMRVEEGGLRVTSPAPTTATPQWTAPSPSRSHHSPSPPSQTPHHCIVRLELGMLEAGDEAFVKLREKVGQWAAKGGFEVRVVRADSAKNGITSPPASPPKNRVAKLAPPPPPPPPPPAAPADYEPRRLPNGPKQTRQFDSPSSSPAELDAEVWQFASDRPAPVEWQPGFYARAFAFISSLVPYDALSAPVFTPSEVALLSFAPNPDALPNLKGKRMRESTSARFENTERLALEYLYKSGPPITLEAIRLVLLTRSYPSLLLYVRKLSKIVLARDALVVACNHVLEGRLYLRRGDPTVVDPIEELISVVERMRDNVAYRKALFATSPTHLARKPLFSPSQIGVGPFRRYAEDLAWLVQCEEEVKKEMGVGGGTWARNGG